jgi:hypothetical protein
VIFRKLDGLMKMLVLNIETIFVSCVNVMTRSVIFIPGTLTQRRKDAENSKQKDVFRKLNQKPIVRIFFAILHLKLKKD